MKAPPNLHPVFYEPTEAEIRALAHELYIRSGWLGGRDLDNWLEAEAWLRLHPPVAAGDTHAPEHRAVRHRRH